MKRLPLLLVAIVGSFFIGSQTTFASEFGLTWDGTHFASTTPTTGAFCLTDYPYDSTWGAYGTGIVSPTSSSDFSTWTVSPAGALASAISRGRTSGDFYIQDCLTPSNPTQYAIFHVGGGGSVTPVSLDGDESTHVINISEPALYSTTTSPVNVTFTWRQGASNPANGYKLNFVNSLTHQSFYSTGSFNDGAATGLNTESTSTPLTGDGTWKLSVSLISWSPDVPGSYQYHIDTSDETWFGLNYNDNVTTVTLGPSCVVRDPSVCEVSFAGTFDLGECVAYLIVPSSCNVIDNYREVPTTLSQRFPFAYIASIANTWSGLTASTTQNAPEFSYQLASVGLGSTTAMGNILPNVVVFSASTTKQYFPSGTFEALKSIFAIALILGTFSLIFSVSRRKLAQS